MAPVRLPLPTRWAIFQSVSPVWVGPYSLASVTVTAPSVTASTGPASAGSGARPSSGVSKVGATPRCLRCRAGGSTSTVYSRDRRPPGQSACTRKFRKGSRTGSSVVTSTTLLPLALTIGLNRSCVRKKGRSMPSRAKASLLATTTCRRSNSSGRAEIISISARNGSCRAESKRISPNPKAMTAWGIAAASAVATKTHWRIYVVPPSSFRKPRPRNFSHTVRHDQNYSL